MAIIVIDPGHGGHDAGAVGSKSIEKDNVLKVALKLSTLLKGAGHTVHLTRSKDEFVSLSGRAKFANDKKADIFVSLHNNSASNNTATGFETFIFDGKVSGNTTKLQNSVHDAIAGGIGIRDRGKKKANFAVVRETNMPAVLVEYAFINNESDEKILINDVDKLAQLTAEGIVKHVGGKLSGGSTAKPTEKPSKKPVDKPKPKPKPTTAPSKPKAPSMASTYKGRRVQSKVDGLRYYAKQSWDDKDVAGRVNKGIGFPTIMSRHKVGNGYQYKVKNSKGKVFYITASSQYVDVVGSSPSAKPKPAVKTKSRTYKKGSKVTIKSSAKFYATGEPIPAKYKGKSFTVQQVGTSKLLLKELYSWIKTKDVT